MDSLFGIVWREGSPLTVTQIVKTCTACPAQWEGKTNTGDWIYVRYRHGTLAISLWPDSEGDGEWLEIFATDHGDRLGGWMEYEEMVKIAPDWITWPESEYTD